FSLKVGPWSQLCFIVAMAITCMPVRHHLIASGASCFLVHLVVYQSALGRSLLTRSYHVGFGSAFSLV
ncbi:hypothetical protein H0E87_010752, partial [Populus deltoides]